MTIKSFLYFSIYFVTSFIGGPSLGNIFFNETLDNFSLLGMVLIVVSGTLTIIISQK